MKYFSGTATYTTRFTLSPEDLSGWVTIDLGGLNDIASLTVNGEKVADLWYPPYRTDITDFLVVGENTVAVAVTNNWANLLIGDEQYAPDFEWGEDRGETMGRAMKAFPDWFLKGEKRPNPDRKGFVLWSYFRADSPLQPAGLTGPVTLSFLREK